MLDLDHNGWFAERWRYQPPCRDPVLIIAPQDEPVTPDEVRARTGLDATSTNLILNPLITVARQILDGYDGRLGRALMTQTWELRFDWFPAYEIVLPLPPLQSVVSVKYLDDNEVEQTVDPADYMIDGQRLVAKSMVSWPSSSTSTPGAVRIQFKAGYGDDGEDVPEPIRQWIAMKAGMLRSISRPDFAVRSETVDGVGSRTWGSPSDYAGHADVMDVLIYPYRVSPGIA